MVITKKDHRENFSRMEKEGAFTICTNLYHHVYKLRAILSTIFFIHTHDEILLETRQFRARSVRFLNNVTDTGV